MTGILDRLAKRHAPPSKWQQYRPTTPEHFFALRLAHRLNHVEGVHHYAELCDRYSEAVLLAAYRSVINSQSDDLPRAFHEALKRPIKDGSGTMPPYDLAAIRIERRAIAVAIFQGRNLKYPPIAHQLSSDPDKALGSAAIFVNRIRDKCHFSSAAMELLPAGSEVQRSRLTKVVTEVLVNAQVGVHQFAKSDILGGFGYPPLRFRNQVREVISVMWPEVNGGFGAPLIKDALALGLYCQIENLLTHG